MSYRTPLFVLVAALAAGSLVAFGCSNGDLSAYGTDRNPELNVDGEAPNGGQQFGTGLDAAKTQPPSIGSPLCHLTKLTCNPDDEGTRAATGVDPRGAFVCGSSSDAGDAQSATCRVVGDTQAIPDVECQTAKEGGDGASCASGADCAPGYECVADGVCRHYCCNGTCDPKLANGKAFCDIVPQKTSQLPVPACVPARSCDLLKDSCGPNETCAVVGQDLTSCVRVGPAQAGQSCDEEHCGPGLTCIGTVGSRKCFQLCKISGAACPSNQQCRIFSQVKDPQIGICDGASPGK